MKKLALLFASALVMAIAYTEYVKATSVMAASHYMADSANTASSIVFRDSNGDFSAGTITASLTGAISSPGTGQVTTAKIDSDAVTTPKILLADQTAGKVACVTTAKSIGFCASIGYDGDCDCTTSE